MKLSEAIRLGAMLKPQARGMFVNGGTCALGAALEAVGESPASRRAELKAKELWPVLRTAVMSPSGTEVSVHSFIWAANDMWGWTRECIADWVATIEDAQQPKAQPESVEVLAEP